MSNSLANRELVAERVRVCHVDGCTRPARLAVKTERRQRIALKTIIWHDDRAAPAAAIPYCHEHGAELTTGLVLTLTASDAL